MSTASDTHTEKHRNKVVPRSKAKRPQSKGIPKSVKGADVERKPPVVSSLKQRPRESLSTDVTSSKPAPQLPLKTDDRAELTIGPSLPPQVHKNVESNSTKSTEVIADQYYRLFVILQYWRAAKKTAKSVKQLVRRCTLLMLAQGSKVSA